MCPRTGTCWPGHADAAAPSLLAEPGRKSELGRRLAIKRANIVTLLDELERDTIEHLGAKERDQLLALLRKFQRIDPEPDLDR